MRKVLVFCLALVWLGLQAAARAGADQDGPQAYSKFIEGAQAQHGLFTLWRKSGKVYIEISKAQLDRDFVQSAVPVNGLGGFGIYSGAFDYAPARLIRFTRADDKIAIIWPNASFLAKPDSPAERAVKQSFADSVVGLAKIAAEDQTTGHIVFEATPFLSDVIDMADALKQNLGTKPDQAYHLNSEESYFGPSKAFPKNVLIEARQTWETSEPAVVDNVPDARTIQFRIDYNIIAPPDDRSYMPRLADDRVGFFDNPYLDFGDDRKRNRQVHYAVRWNMQPSDPSKPLSPATHPMVFYLGNTIPMEYRAPLRDGLLAWNAAFERIGISDAVQVMDQPDDPNWDPDDIRYNVVRWLTESNGGGFAEAQIVIDPRTGEEFHTGVLFDADLMLGGNSLWRYLVDPTRNATGSGFGQREAAYAAGMHDQAVFGGVALDLMGRSSSYDMPEKFRYAFLKSLMLHEAGHDMGLQHNFIGSQAYTAKDLQSTAFTSRYGVATSVMEYAPLNLWPKKTPQGAYWQSVLGPYDYYAIHWGYARIPGARTPQDEVPVLNRWAAAWSNPRFRFASDEDVAWFNGHAIDPRVNQWDLSNDTLGWCETQMKIHHTLFNTLDRRFPRYGEDFEAERQAFGSVARQYARCALMTEHFIGAEYLSRAHMGDPRSGAPLTPVPRSQELRAWRIMNDSLFSDDAWRFSPAMLNRLTYTEWGSWSGAQWAYNPPDRHDLPVVDIVGAWQTAALNTMFQPLVLQRLRDTAVTAKPGQTMSLTDLFDWAQQSVYGDLRSAKLRSIPLIHRNLQQSYARLLMRLVNAPAENTPYDAQSLARAKLAALKNDIQAAQKRPLDEITRAHLSDLSHRISQGLDARPMLTQPRV
ncbi:MAG: hypothetical protein DLM53_06975 [Candidatus Eremiobacter antarcticus]|nr:zinc-dependent metalloprotease [Candidatus Eremiobacteraeota bacterium]MBC5808727.1 zinc-dependent metalloprotease [Candidatus Eremiobacteraeota bacterium]PZR62201.1 MAG: hypothetical protein DLM53_06975 [Candidatus Eremiobacter sp. RRmetagenome_bin22]